MYIHEIGTGIAGIGIEDWKQRPEHG